MLLGVVGGGVPGAVEPWAELLLGARAAMASSSSSRAQRPWQAARAGDAAVFSTRGRQRAGDTAGQAPSVSGRERTWLRAVERSELGHGEEKKKGRVGLLVCWAERKKKIGFSYSNLFKLS